MNDHSFDKLIKEKADQHEAPVPPGAWANIEQDQKKRRSRFFWWPFVILLAGLGLYGIYNLNHSHSGYNSSVEKTSSTAPPLASSASQQTNKNSDTDKIAASQNNIVSEKEKNNKTSVSDQKNNNNIVSSSTSDKTASSTTKPSSPSTQALLKELKKKTNIHSDDETNDNFSRNNNKRSTRTKTKVTIQSGTVANDDETSKEDNSIVVSDKNIVPPINEINNDRNNDQNDSLRKTVSVAELLATKQDTSLKSTVNISLPKKDKKQRSAELTVDISANIFAPLMNGNGLTSATRNINTSTFRSNFKADKIDISGSNSFSYSAIVRKKIAPKFSIGTGIQYSVIKENIHLSGRETTIQISTVKRLRINGGNAMLVDDTVSATSNGSRVINAVNSYEIFSIPLAVQFRLTKWRQWELSANAGFRINVSNHYRNSINGHFEKVFGGNAPSGTGNKFSSDLFAAIRVSRNLGKRYALFAEPTMLYNLIKYDIAESFRNNRINRAGIGIGLSWKMGK